MSKSSLLERQHMNMLALRMKARELRCCVYKNRIATERSHPRGPFWETGTGLKAQDFFIIPLSAEAHLEYHRDIEAFEIAHGTHAELLKAFWQRIWVRSRRVDDRRDLAHLILARWRTGSDFLEGVDLDSLSAVVVRLRPFPLEGLGVRGCDAGKQEQGDTPRSVAID